ncbi:carotenoid biosynthesis protein [Phaeodactylibacter luteus]|uniref:Carotenoid biosynthesis protein n=1 Tax=Phaeodactylibacter luteus TaxID=1564516 RepID=A0A5C6RTB4_9BACT|nr:carotenoid biosynthesis protein [Phaeodactylibacter luteus]TXB65591.1 carotenoid biosynthesis protein [Phaeodactylibacter luteus]
MQPTAAATSVPAGKRAWTAPRAIAVLAILYAVGVVGILLPVHPDFILLTPLNLLVSVGVMLSFHRGWGKPTLFYLLVAYVVGFGAELFGVQTGLLFGDYAYGKVLGPKVWGTPLMIGVNWLMLGYASGVLANRLLPGRSFWWRGSLSAVLMVALDVIIEPVAMAFGFWSWGGGEIPLQNFAGWMAVALPLQLLFAYLHPGLRNKVGVALFFLQVAFFAILLVLGTA